MQGYSSPSLQVTQNVSELEVAITLNANVRSWCLLSQSNEEINVFSINAWTTRYPFGE